MQVLSSYLETAWQISKETPKELKAISLGDGTWGWRCGGELDCYFSFLDFLSNGHVLFIKNKNYIKKKYDDFKGDLFLNLNINSTHL